MADEIDKAGITATAYRTKWWTPEETIDGLFNTAWRSETSGGPSYIQWDLGSAYILDSFDFYNYDSPYGLNGTVSMHVSNDETFVESTMVLDLNSTYGVDKLAQPFYLHGTSTPVSEAMQYVRITGNNWAMQEIFLYGAPEFQGLDLTDGGAANIDNQYMLRMPTFNSYPTTSKDKFSARMDYRYIGLAIVCIETSTDVWTVSPHPGVAAIDVEDLNAASYVFYGGETYTVSGSLAAALTTAGYL